MGGWMNEMTQGWLPMQQCYSPSQIGIIAPTLRTWMVSIGCPMSTFNFVIQGPNANVRGLDWRGIAFLQHVWFEDMWLERIAPRHED